MSHTQWLFLHRMTVLRQMFLQKMLFRPCRTLSSIRNFRASSTSSFVESNFILIKSPSSFPQLCKSSFSQEASNVSLVSVLQHPEYKEMKRKLKVEAQSALDIVCLHILTRWYQSKSEKLCLQNLMPSQNLTFTLFHNSPSSNRLKVSQIVLDLNAVSLHTFSKWRGDAARLKELEEQGLLIIGKHLQMQIQI